MKKNKCEVKKILLLFLFLSGACLLTAQSFHRGGVVMDLNSGIEFYNTSLNYNINNAIKNRDTSLVSKAANVNLAFGIEVGIKKHFGIGLRGKANLFFKELDAASKNQSTVKSSDLILFLNLHPIVRKKLDLIIGTDLGWSTLNFNVYSFKNNQIQGSGAYLTAYVNPRIYFKRWGFNIKAYLPFVSYTNLNAASDNLDKYILSTWKGNGFGVSVGVQLKLN